MLESVQKVDLMKDEHMRVGVLTQFPSPAVQSGPAIHTRFLQQGLEKRGHKVVMMGPNTDGQEPVEGCQDHLFPGYRYPTHPEVKIGMPGSPTQFFKSRPVVDVIHAQANCHMLHYGVWARKMWRVPFINTHIVHIPTHSHFILNDALYERERVRSWLEQRANEMERIFAKEFYNESDCLVVQSRHYVDYWRERGVTVPIEVVGRPINPTIFSTQPNYDPYPESFKVGHRLLVVCRHDREKNLRQVIDIFAREIAQRDRNATLTLVGDGHDHRNLVEYSMKTGFHDRIHFPGEAKHAELVNWYSYSDLFVYTSLSETFGNVVNEALWSGVPVVALDDRMGVAGQLVNGVNGVLIEPEDKLAEQRFANAVLALLRNDDLRMRMGGEAATLARRSAHPDIVLSRFEKIYENAERHCRDTIKRPLSQAPRLTQMRTASQHYAAWGFWNGLLLSLAYSMNRLGGSRGDANQHAEITKAIEAVKREKPSITARFMRPAQYLQKLGS